ncbi:hypothetical protein [Streptomyces apocyni]|uniref:hypothetical protein n=1 Tax=Streptomyces apocyni TaxID=2654677 RepID=UPI0012EAB626|nr:hypothetical protein [Streptomyces apocyni]
MSRWRVRRAGAVLAGCGVLLLAGCGIRATEVPTDFGPAPSRVACVTTAQGVEARAAGGTLAQVFLVCGSQLVAVDRTVELPQAPDGDAGAGENERVPVAQALLDALRQPTSEEEAQAGFATDLRARATVTGPREGDPKTALRLSTPPEGLSPFALAQVVCTFAHSAVASGEDTVILGGRGSDPLRSYACTDALRARPGTVPVPTETVGG